jgi:hypothetical protein
MPFAVLVPVLTGLALLTACSSASVTPSGPDVPPGIRVDVTPRDPQVPYGTSTTFAAAVSGTANTAVTWTVVQAGGGTINPTTGLYTAPSATGTFSVVATSVAQPTATGSSSVFVVPPGSIDNTVLPPERRTSWSPGIPGGIPTYATVHTTINATTYGNGTTDATNAINNALAAAGAVATAANPQVVYLPAGTYRVAGTIGWDASYVVLRGAGPGLTKLRANQGQAAVYLGNSNYPASAVNITGSVPRNSTTITVASAASFKVGDVIQIDQLDDPSYVFIFDSIYRKRAPGWSNSGPVSAGRTGHSGYRSVTEMKEITAINGTTLTFSPPTRIAFDAAFAPQAWRVISGPNSSGAGVRWSGLENLYVTGGGNDNIVLDGAAYSWVRNVESDGNPATGVGTIGHHINLAHSFRSEVRHVYVHHANHIGQGGGAYGIGLTVSSSDNLVEDSIAVYLNKAVLTEVSGGGNVFGYNYIDNVRTDSAAWMEGAANGSHDAFSHHDLWEGNQATNIGCDATHGSSGFLVFFRNYAMGRASDTGYANVQSDNVRAFNSDAWNREMTFIGNVGHAYRIPTGINPVYEISSHLVDPNPAAIWHIGDMDMRGGGGVFDTQYANPGPNDPGVLPLATYTTRSLDKLFRHGNWDNVTSSIADWQAGYTRTLPNSLYLTNKPTWWGASPWPWVDTSAATRLQSLPAKVRYDAGQPL